MWEVIRRFTIYYIVIETEFLQRILLSFFVSLKDSFVVAFWLSFKFCISGHLSVICSLLSIITPIGASGANSVGAVRSL